MKLKHFAGYGVINAKKVYKGANQNGVNILRVAVYGDHEQSLLTSDLYTLYKWLFLRFEKNSEVKNPYTDFIDVRYKWIDVNGSEGVLYSFYY